MFYIHIWLRGFAKRVFYMHVYKLLIYKDNNYNYICMYIPQLIIRTWCTDLKFYSKALWCIILLATWEKFQLNKLLMNNANSLWSWLFKVTKLDTCIQGFHTMVHACTHAHTHTHTLPIKINYPMTNKCILFCAQPHTYKCMHSSEYTGIVKSL